MTATAIWQRSRLGDFFRIKHGFAFKGEFFTDEGNSILLTPGNFNPDGGLKLKGDKEKYYSGDIPEEFVLKKSDLIVAMTDLTQNAPILGSPAIIPEDGLFLHNQRLGKIIELNEDKLNRKFLYYLFNTWNVRAQIKASATGATVKHTAPERIYNVEVCLPPLPIQRKIAAIISAYDDLIENNLRRVEILEKMAQNLYTEWFVKFCFPGHEKVRMVDSPLGRIPEGWGVIKVGKIIQRISTGKQYDKNTVKTSGAVPVLDQGQSGVIGYHDDSPGIFASGNAPVIVFANHTCYQRIIQFPFSAIQNVLPYVPNPESYRNIYWLYWGTKDLVKINDYKGHWPEFTSKEIVLPPTSLCSNFGNYVETFVRQCYKLELKNNNLHRSRTLLLPKLISGGLEVSDLDIKTGDDE